MHNTVQVSAHVLLWPSPTFNHGWKKFRQIATATIRNRAGITIVSKICCCFWDRGGGGACEDGDSDVAVLRADPASSVAHVFVVGLRCRKDGRCRRRGTAVVAGSVSVVCEEEEDDGDGEPNVDVWWSPTVIWARLSPCDVSGRMAVPRLKFLGSAE
mmetsp:Transcript_82649/g.167485  ORF Transcript_82649/g.167485 Transcript_82649/m.167485 type:complete len:157 (+) Transcript_82649:2433-2903(+)